MGQVQGKKTKVTKLFNGETESVSRSNLKFGRRLEHALLTAMASYKGLWSSVIARGRDHNRPTVSAVNTGQHGPSTRLLETRARQHGPCWREMETGHPSTRAVNSGRQLG